MLIALLLKLRVAKEIPSAAPIINGRMYRIGQIGTLVRIVLGNLNLYGLVASVSNLPSNADALSIEPNCGSMFLQVQLIGEKIGGMKFERGVGAFPTVNDEVHIVTEEDLKDIYGEYEEGLIEIGKHSSSENLSVFVDLHNLVLRHSAILGSTGSGKSNATAHIIKKILNDKQGSRIVLVDIHGEYASAFEGKANIFRINHSDNQLYIPFWTMTFDELAFFLVGRPDGQERAEDKKLREEIVRAKKENAAKLGAGKVDVDYVTADSPIPFDIRKLWHDFNREVNATHSVSGINDQHRETEELINEGDPQKLVPATFKPYGMGSAAPHKAKDATMYAYEKKIYSRLKDSRFDFLLNPGKFYNAEGENDIDQLLRNWIDHENRLTILDLSGVPFELIDLSVGLLTRMIFDSMFWGRSEEYTGRKRPLLMVYEEAHVYLPKGEGSSHIYGYARKAVEKIFKEGRKFGIGAMVVTQRPSDISETILAQVGTFIALRLTNSSDQGTIKSAAPNNIINIIDLLSSLRIGEAIVVGEAIKVPSRVRIQLVEPRPSSNDPKLVECWSKKFESSNNNYKKIVTAWREEKHIKKSKEA